MRWTAWWLVPLVTAIVAVACSEKPDDEKVHPPPTVNPDYERDAGPSTEDDAGAQPKEDGGADGGGDAGTPSADAGTDGGTHPATDGGSDAGTDAGTDGGTTTPIQFPSSTGWQFFGPQHGGPAEVWGVSSDAAGNVWVAGGADGLFLLTPGASTFKQFTAADGLNASCDISGTTMCKVISVTGGPANTVFVGYEGAGTDSESDPMWQQQSGDADKVVWNGAALTVTHYDISSPPGLYSDYPAGREKIRSVHRILWDAKTGNVWFGGNHGVALYDAKDKMVWEHQHAAINGYKKTAAEDPSGTSYTMMSGDWRGIGLDEYGDLWMGGAHRVAKIRYATEGNQFWATVDPIIDVWPDAVADHARPEQRTDDEVQELLVDSGARLWVGGMQGLARVTPTGTWYVPKADMVDPKVTALERDPKDGSIWVGHLWGGITRIQGNTNKHYSWDAFGKPLIDYVVRDIQSDEHNGKRRIFVAFSGGAVGIYTGD